MSLWSLSTHLLHRCVNCPEGGVCVTDLEDPSIRFCLLPDEGCTVDADCLDDSFVCRDNQCRNRCDEETECAPGLDCLDNACVEGSSTDGDADIEGDADSDADIDADDEGEPPVTERWLPRPELTGDEFDDLVVMTEGGSYGELLVFAGGPTFDPSSPTDAAVTITSAGPCTLRGPMIMVDGNSDVHVDLVVFEQCGSSIQVVFIEGPFTSDAYALDDVAHRVVLESHIATPPTNLAVADLDADGLEDLVMSFHEGLDGNYGPEEDEPGVVNIYSDIQRLASDTMAVPYTTIEGPNVSDYFGVGLDSAPTDLTGDGIVDLLVGASQVDLTNPDYVFRVGKAYLFEGPIPASSEPLDAEMLTYAQYLGVRERDHCGAGVAIAELTGDEELDIVIGVDEDTTSGAAQYEGRVYLVPDLVREPRDLVLATDAWSWVNGGSREEFGVQINGHGDLDGDGDEDLLVRTVYGSSGQCSSFYTVFSPWEASGEKKAAYELYFEGCTERIPINSSIAGDLDDDGDDDLVFGLPTRYEGRGAVYVVFGTIEIDTGPISEQADVTILDDTDLLGLGVSVLSR